MNDEETIGEFLRTHYTDERLAMLLAHAEDGLLSHMSCCCLAGIPSANHALKTREDFGDADSWTHGAYNPETEAKRRASVAFNSLGDGPGIDGDDDRADALRRSRIIPLIRAEIARRDELKIQVTRESRDSVDSLAQAGVLT